MNKTLIADSGSTKTHWLIKDKSEVIKEFYTKGLNPYFISSDDVITSLSEHISEEEFITISEIYFYGAGCNSVKKCAIIEKAFQNMFPNANYSVNSDLLGAAMALFGSNSGVACILGTGSNASVFDGNKFINTINSLGYILGDQGSGAYFGKLLLRDYFQNKMPINLYLKFKNNFEITHSEVLDSVYKLKFPNKYLAKFTVFLGENRGEVYVENLLKYGFQEFIDSQLSVLDFDKAKFEVGFVGSIAFYFKDILEKIILENGYNISRIIKEPMDGLKLIAVF